MKVTNLLSDETLSKKRRPMCPTFAKTNENEKKKEKEKEKQKYEKERKKRNKVS